MFIRFAGLPNNFELNLIPYLQSFPKKNLLAQQPWISISVELTVQRLDLSTYKFKTYLFKDIIDSPPVLNLSSIFDSFSSEFYSWTYISCQETPIHYSEIIDFKDLSLCGSPSIIEFYIKLWANPTTGFSLQYSEVETFDVYHEVSPEDVSHFDFSVLF